jgi:hypothetical protein
MNRLFDNLFGRSYETRVLSKRSPQSQFLLLLIYMFFLGMFLDGALAGTPDRWFFVAMAVVVFRDARVIFGVLSRAPQPEAPSLSIVASSK